MISVFEHESKKEFSLIANEGREKKEFTEIKIMSLYDGIDGVELTGFDRIGFSAGFKTKLKEYNAIKGTYGIKIKIRYAVDENDINEQLSNIKIDDYTSIEEYYAAIDKIISEKTKDFETTLYFNNDEMYGDTYNFKTFFSQEQVFDISGISNNIKKIDIYAFQKSNFQDINGNFIDYNNIKITEANRIALSNIFVNNIKIYLGYDIEKFSTDTILLYCPDNDLTYGANTQSEQQPKNILARWIHKDEEKGFICLKNIINGFELRWYKQDPSATSDGYCGKGWKHLEEFNNSTEIAFIPSITEAQETLKTIGFVINQDGEKTYYPGESITFINSNYNVSQQQATAQTAAQIHCKDGTEGNYFIYNQNNKLNNNAEGTAKKRQFEFLWQGKKPTVESGLTSVKWILPYETTMIYLAEEDYKDWPDRGVVYEDTGKPYLVIEKKLQYNEDGTNNLDDIILQDYSIRNTWSPSRGNNHIRCVATVKGIEYEAIEDLNFGKAGTTGTNATLVLEFEGEVALTATPGDEIAVSAYLYNASGELIPWTDELKKGISWSWKDNSNKYINATFTEGSTTAKLVWPTGGRKTVPDDNYSILQCTLPWSNHNNKTYDLVSYLPIPIKRNKYDSYIEGATEILYDATGTPHYDKNVYKLFEKTNIERVQGIEWAISAKVKDKYLPILKQNDNGVALSANPFFIKGSSDKVCVCCKDSGNGVVYWSQPILIMESQYGFSMLNSWDGTLQINENDGTIMSTMLGAGKKNSDNTFSGVLIGDVEKGTGNSMISTTGVYGLQDGMITYALTEDGKATFGKANGAGQIIIDGNEGTIQSGNYDKDSSGMKINLQDGHIDAYNFKLTSSKILMDSSGGNKKDAYLKVVDGKNTLISIGEKDYYLQSITQKTKIDLAKSEIYLESESNPQNSILLQTSAEPYFLVKGSYTPDSGVAEQKTLISLGTNNYYLQSADYSPQGYSTNSQGYILYKDKNNNTIYYNGSSYINNDTGAAIGFTYSLESVAKYKGYYNEDNGSVDTSKVTREDQTKYAEYQKSIYNQMLTPIMDSNKSGAGMHINLGTGMIVGYDLFLQAYNSNDKSKILTISSADEYAPLKIGDKFRVNWDGSLVCDNITYLGTKPQENGYVININDNFTVSASGGMSASSANIGSGWFGGTANKAKSTTYADSAGTCSIANAVKGAFGIDIITSIGTGSFSVSLPGGGTLKYGKRSVTVLPYYA